MNDLKTIGIIVIVRNTLTGGLNAVKNKVCWMQMEQNLAKLVF